MLSDREKKLAAAIVIVGVLGGGIWIGKYYLEARSRLAQEIARTENQANMMDMTARKKAKVDSQWQELLDGGLKFDQSLAATQAVQAIEKFAADRRVTVEFSNIVSLQQPVGEFWPVDMTVKAHGSDLHVIELLYMMETAKFPLKISNVQITPVKEGQRDVVATINVTTAAYKEGTRKPGARS